MSKVFKNSFKAVVLTSALFFGVANVAEAATVQPGQDYLVTPLDGAKFTFPDLGQVFFKGLPIGSPEYGATDTVAERLDPVAPIDGETDLVIRELSLESMAPVNGKDVFVGLNPNVLSSGTMQILHTNDDVNNDGDPDDGYWGSVFDIHAVAIVADQGTLDPQGINFVAGLIEDCPPGPNGGPSPDGSYECIYFNKSDFRADFPITQLLYPWAHVPFSPTQVVGPESSNFFLDPDVLIFHETPDGNHHVVRPTQIVPEPTTIIGSLFGLGILGKFKQMKAKKK